MGLASFEVLSPVDNEMLCHWAKRKKYLLKDKEEMENNELPQESSDSFLSGCSSLQSVETDPNRLFWY